MNTISWIFVILMTFAGCSQMQQEKDHEESNFVEEILTLPATLSIAAAEYHASKGVWPKSMPELMAFFDDKPDVGIDLSRCSEWVTFETLSDGRLRVKCEHPKLQFSGIVDCPTSEDGDAKEVSADFRISGEPE